MRPSASYRSGARICAAQHSSSFNAVPNAHFCEESHCIVLNGLNVDPKLQSYLPIGQAVRQITEHLPLSISQSNQISAIE